MNMKEIRFSWKQLNREYNSPIFEKHSMVKHT